MLRDKKSFKNLQQYCSSSIKFGNNDGEKIVGKGLVKFGDGKIKTQEVIFIVGLKHNLLSVNQICDKGNDIIFKKHGYEIRRENNGKLAAHGRRTFGNLYTLVENIKYSCLLIQENANWLWYKRLGHINFDNLANINSKEAIRDMPNILKPSESICSSCQKGKQT